MRINEEIDIQEAASKYATADPFPHCVIDGLFPEQCLVEVSDEIDTLPKSSWRIFCNERELKWGFLYPGFRDTALHKFLIYLGSPEVLGCLEQLTGIDGLIPDPYYGGGGVHYVPPGGYLAVHSDFNWHPKLKLDRRVNVLIFLNKGWREEYGGHLELWDGEPKEPRKRILPIFNRTVVFNTTDSSFHGHPEPLHCPPTRGRKSISAYYYTNGRPAEEASVPHDTIFLNGT